MDRNALERNYQALKNEQSNWIDHWRDLADYLLPRQAQFNVTDNRGNKRNPKIVDMTGTLALRALAAGLMSGITNPSRPWFQFRTVNPSLVASYGVKTYLEEVRKRVAEVFLKSNLYTTLPGVYQDLGAFAVSAFEVHEDPDSVIRCYAWPIGSYVLGVGPRCVVNQAYREHQMTVEQVVKQFGYENCTPSTKSRWDTQDFNGKLTVFRSIIPNDDADDRRMEGKYKPFRSLWWEKGSQPEEYLQDSGYDMFPVISPRWQVVGDDVWGSNGPGMEALGDVMALQVQQRDKARVIAKQHNPTINAPASLRNVNGGVTNLPGGVIYTDIQGQRAMVQPVFIPNPQAISSIREDNFEIRQRINEAFYKNLFQMFANDDRSGVTATEIAARQEEKLLNLGPVYLRLNDELLDPLLTRTLAIMTEKSRPYWEGKLNGEPPLPPPPPELQDEELAIEYISIMAQAMRAVGVASIERSMAFTGSMAQAFPGVLDNINSDKTLREYWELAGASPELLEDPEAVAAKRAQVAQQAQAQQMLQNAQQAASVAQTMSQTNLTDNNALTQIMQRIPAMGGSVA